MSVFVLLLLLPLITFHDHHLLSIIRRLIAVFMKHMVDVAFTVYCHFTNDVILLNYLLSRFLIAGDA